MTRRSHGLAWHIAVRLGLLLTCVAVADLDAQGGRRTVGLALGGGAARGLAHVGVLRWLDEHHVPVHAVAGTSMGGLVGGAYAAGMSPDEIDALVLDTDWAEMFGASSHRFKSIRRKDDERDYPSRLAFRLRGVALPSAINSGQQIDFLLSRIGAAYAGLASFDSLPTPFRSVALDLRTGDKVVLGSGSLPVAMRATMSLPGIFPPVRLGDQVLVDGGAVDNVPADVVHAMHVDVVVAVNVSPEPDSTYVAPSMFAIVSATSDALVQANTKRGIAAANLVLRPDLHGFSGNDWRRAHDLIAAGYASAEAMRDRLQPFAVDEATWRAYLAARAARRARMPLVTGIRIEGMTPADEVRMRRVLRSFLGSAADPSDFERTLTRLSGFDRYESLSWDLDRHAAGVDLVVRAQPEQGVPPTIVLAINAQSRTNTDYRFQVATRTLAYGSPGSTDEVRVDAVLGPDPSIGAQLLHPLVTTGRATLFVAGTGGAFSRSIDSVRNDAVFAQYVERSLFAQGDVGIDRPDAELRVGFRAGQVNVGTKVTSPPVPSFSGGASELVLRGVYDTQDTPAVPSEGARLELRARHVLSFPNTSVWAVRGTNDGLTQADLTASGAWSWRQRAERIFVAGFGGTSFGGTPLVTDQFALGWPLRLDAFGVGERRGDNYAVLTAGYLHTLARLPDFVGGSIMAGGWVEGGSAWDSGTDSHIDFQAAGAIVIETFISPAVVRYSIGAHVRRFAIGVGRLF